MAMQLMKEEVVWKELSQNHCCGGYWSALADDFRTFLRDAPAVLYNRFSDLAFIESDRRGERDLNLRLPTISNSKVIFVPA